MLKGYGLLQVYTGTGKGKTTAALGVALRAAGYGAKTMMLSFLKDDQDYGEARAYKFIPGFTLKQVGRDAFVNFKDPEPQDLAMAREGWEEAKRLIEAAEIDILILDEFNIVLATGMIDQAEALAFLRQHKGRVEIICTGREAPVNLLNMADLVTDMKELKHYFYQDIASRNGIDH